MPYIITYYIIYHWFYLSCTVNEHWIVGATEYREIVFP